MGKAWFCAFMSGVVSYPKMFKIYLRPSNSDVSIFGWIYTVCFGNWPVSCHCPITPPEIPMGINTLRVKKHATLVLGINLAVLTNFHILSLLYRMCLLPPTKEEVISGGICFCPCLFVCLSVCLWARLLKRACMDLDEILHVDRRRDMDELINFWARSGL